MIYGVCVQEAQRNLESTQAERDTLQRTLDECREEAQRSVETLASERDQLKRALESHQHQVCSVTSLDTCNEMDAAHTL
jgi:hypothetical protein